MVKLSKKNRKKILSILEENHNLQRACKKAGIARSTLYRWMKNDAEFQEQVRDAQEIGNDTMNDYTESKLLVNVQEGNQRAIEFYLRHNNPRYAATRVESEYFSKRGIARTLTLPVGVDQMYYQGELRGIEYATSLLMLKHLTSGGEIDLESYIGETTGNAEYYDPGAIRNLFDTFPQLQQEYETRVNENKLKQMADRLKKQESN